MAGEGITDPSRVGQINSVGGSDAADNALFLKKFSGEILQTFEEIIYYGRRRYNRPQSCRSD
jgi:hypothetical protein